MIQKEETEAKNRIKRKGIDLLHILLWAFIVLAAVMFIGNLILHYYPMLKELIETGAIS